MSEFENPENANPDGGENPADDAPLAVDATGLHALVDQLAGALHDYVDTAVGVRSEFDANTADDDPRVEAAERAVERCNTAFDSRFEKALGMVCAHTGFADDDDDEEDDSDDVDEESVILELTFGPATRGADTATMGIIQEAMERLDAMARELATEFEHRGVTISHWSCVHEMYIDDEDDE
ncbi:hypothetical protein [Rarobacter incanus]|uniref:Uncharacterized protein n=1 Tax=Rarobacter incanus TaxID=153494 RepID=A0A542SN82_9MICO|nr:hypothetical protein [Rarobacter incanus]TQK76083.1 hypothetical protein FB389_0741 [Rarobacter incanus]